MSEDNGHGLEPKTYSEYREQWTHEDELINHRLGWLLTSQTILYAGYGLLLQVPGEKSNPQADGGNQIKDLTQVLGWIGIATSIFIFLSIVAAVTALCVLRKKGGLNPGRVAFHLGLVSPLSLPLVFLAGWWYILWPLPSTPRYILLLVAVAVLGLAVLWLATSVERRLLTWKQTQSGQGSLTTLKK
jgi:hypothetical protein